MLRMRRDLRQVSKLYFDVRAGVSGWPSLHLTPVRIVIT